MSHRDHIHWGEDEVEHGCEHLLEVRGLHVHYGPVCALHDIRFKVSCGHSLALLGSNGAGKSTLLKSIAGLLPAGQGEIYWRGQPVRKHTYEIAYLPQREAVDWNFPITVRGMVEMGCYAQLGAWRKFGEHEAAVVDKAIAAMQLEDIQSRQISALSGGQQQRAFIARALAQEAHVLLLDEPFTGLDQPSQEMLTELLKQLVQEGRLVIASHHDLKTVARSFDLALLIKREIVAFGEPAEAMSEAHLAEAFSS
ncbi:MAG: ABC-type Mn2+/Zn2+ transport system ATPase subunit [Candidatus Omnitrophota bacterium]|jgi:ABC-type Mn2+/Zn2+ transport system ATPase subunit